MLPSIPPSWSKFTREERFFTTWLFHDLRQDAVPFWRVLSPRLNSSASVQDVGYEVCFFRDFWHDQRRPIGQLPPGISIKQTFDLVLTLDNRQLVLIEAKAHQGFDNQQMGELTHARNEMLKLIDASEIHLVGLHSNRYQPSPPTRNAFGAMITWQEAAQCYPANQNIYLQADKIYDN